MAAFPRLLSHLEPAPRLACGSLSMWPLRASRHVAFYDSTDYVLAEAARAAGSFSMSEVSQEGEVPRLLVRNDGDLPVFLLDGEEFLGAKQNRIVNLSLLVPARSEIRIPVTCTEQGRWRSVSRDFASAKRTEFAHLRATRLESVSTGFRRQMRGASDQRRVWRSIASKSARMGTHSASGAMADIFAARAAELAEYRLALRAPEDAWGAVYAIGGRPVGLEAFDRASTFAALSDRLIDGYALDAMETRPDAIAQDGEVAAIGAFLREIAIHHGEAYDTPGLGQTVRFAGMRCFGASLETGDRCIHLAAFSRASLDAA